jgi:hypothetical protein
MLASFDDLSSGMDARANAITDIGSGIAIPLVTKSSSDGASIPVQQTALVAGAAAAGLGGVTVIRRRGRRVAA